MSDDDKHYWKGRPLSELSREELYELIDYLASFRADHTTPDAMEAMALGRATMIMRPPKKHGIRLW